MQNQLAKMPSLRGRFLACTVDSLARRLICPLANSGEGPRAKLNLMVSADFTIICHAAALAIAKESVSSWLRLRYPVVVVDELQDCRGDQLYLIQAMEACCHVIAAADEFQDLQQTGRVPPSSGCMRLPARKTFCRETEERMRQACSRRPTGSEHRETAAISSRMRLCPRSTQTWRRGT